MEGITLTVSQLNDYVRRLLASDPIVQHITLRGEISNFKPYASGHWYFTLKDDTGRIDCALFRQYTYGVPFMPQDGMRVLVKGSAGLYVQGGKFQFYADGMTQDGVGDLYRRYLELKERLTAEGLFDASRKRLLPLLPKSRQTLFFSATMPADIVALSKSMLTDPVRVEVTPVSSAVAAIDQRVYFVEKPEKKKLLVSLLREEDKSVLVFSRTKHGADNISRLLSKSGIRSEAIHGNKSQNHRQRVLTDFKSGKIRVMVATDIAARGIDIRELEIVINYDLPDVPETYVHRIGRTGRAGHSGTALTFCTPDERPLMKDIQRLTGKKLNAETYRA